MELGPSIWLTLLTVGVVMLGLAMAYGISRNRKRSDYEKARTEAATREEFRREDRDRT